jgi:hypothetical protein
MQAEEEDAVVGPQLPGVAPGNRGNYGGFLRPGEGELRGYSLIVRKRERR